MDESNDLSMTFPYPIPEYDAIAYWQACNERRLVMQCCADCATFRWYPGPLCPACTSHHFEWKPLSGRGKINTWTVVTHAVHPAAADKIPYVVVLVELEEQQGLTMISNLVDCDIDTIAVDHPVRVDFTAHPNGQKLPIFKVV